LESNHAAPRMRDFRLYQLTDEEFEGLVSNVCRDILGIGTVNFSKGPDGGRDGRFEGTAERFPSAAAPWAGKFIVQAKHSTSPIASCSDGEFSINKSCILNQEIPRIKKLRDDGEVDNYLLLTNRKVTGDTDSRIRDRIRAETGVEQVELLGIETITSLLEANPKCIRLYRLDHLWGPLQFHPQEMKELIETFYSGHLITKAASGKQFDFSYTNIEEKNAKNKLSKEFFDIIKSRSEPYFNKLDEFLGSPINAELAEKYYNLADEFNSKTALRRDQFDAFEQAFEIIYDRVLQEVPEIGPRRRLINIFLHFMYCRCDIGQQ
jgi:C-terminal domain 12 of the ABC-three component (ABC-3C) systems